MGSHHEKALNPVLQKGVEHVNEVFDREGMSQYADQIMADSELIRRMCDGDRDAIEAFFVSFGNFVERFPGILDKRITNGISMNTMKGNSFGKEVVLQNFRTIVEESRTMKKEEGDHKNHWWRAATKMGVDMSDKNLRAWNTNEMQALIAYGDVEKNIKQTAAAAYATEQIAGALSRKLLSSPKFMEAVGGTFVWGNVHVTKAFLKALREHRRPEPSADYSDEVFGHDAIDLLILRSHADSEQELEEARALIRQGMDLFAQAAQSIEARIPESVDA